MLFLSIVPHDKGQNRPAVIPSYMCDIERARMIYQMEWVQDMHNEV